MRVSWRMSWEPIRVRAFAPPQLPLFVAFLISISNHAAGAQSPGTPDPSPPDTAQAPELIRLEDPATALVEAHPADSTGAPSPTKPRISAYPYVYYTPETELAFGAGGLATVYTSRDSGLRPSKVTLSAYYATTGQYKVSLTPLAYFSHNRYAASAALDFGNYVDRFYGIGRDTPDIEDEAQYVSRSTGLELEMQIPPPLGLTTRIGLIYDLSKLSVRDRKSNPYLLAGDVPGDDGGWVSGLGALWLIDTRNHTFVPDKGGLYRAEFVAYGHALGSDYGYTRYRLDLRQYFRVGKERAVACQLYGASVLGGPPFYELPRLGGQNRMRGYYEGRYRDVHYLTGQVEFRTHLFWRVGAAAFYGLGDVSSTLSRIRLKNSRSSYGAGLRIAFQPTQKVNLRVDFGAGENTSGVYFGLEEAF